MKRLFSVVLIAVLLINLLGCAAEVQLPEEDDTQAELEVYRKYDSLISALESGDYDTADEIVDALRLQRYGEQVSSGVLQEIQITQDNWNQYFEVQEITQWQEDDFGKATGFITYVCVVMRDEFADVVVADKSRVDFGWSARCSVKNCSVDLDNRIVNLENEFKSKTTTFGEPEIMTGTVTYTGKAVGTDWSGERYVAAVIGEILLIGEYHLSGQLKPVCYDYDDTMVTQAQGLLVLESIGDENGQ